MYNSVILWRALVGQSLGRQTLADARVITCLAGRWRIDTHTHTHTHSIHFHPLALDNQRSIAVYSTAITV